MPTPSTTKKRLRRPSASGQRYRKWTISLPEEISQAVERRLETRQSETMSALVTEALAEKLEADDLSALLRDMDREFGPIDGEARDWARGVFDSLDRAASSDSQRRA